MAADRVSVIEPQDYELIAQEVSNLRPRIAELEASAAALSERLADVQKVNARLEAAALTTARSLQQIAVHWDAVYEAMRRGEAREEDGIGAFFCGAFRGRGRARPPRSAQQLGSPPPCAPKSTGSPT